MIIKSKLYDIARSYEKAHPKLRIAFWWNEEKFTLIVSMYTHSHKGSSIYEKIGEFRCPTNEMSDSLFILAIAQIVTDALDRKIYVEEA